MRVSVEQRVTAFALSAIAGAIILPMASRSSVWAAVLVVILCIAAVPWIAARMPERLRGARQRRPVLSAVWVLLALIATLQMARLSAFMVDSSRVWGSTIPDPVAANHQCMAAYVHAADLSRRGETNIYAERWYPAFTTSFHEFRDVSSPVDGLGRWIVDPYHYPPPFLLLPRAALAITNSFDRIRTAWFLIQSLVFLTAGLLLASWIGGREGLVSALLLPAVLASIPTMLNFQFGQFHAMAIMLAVAAMVAFEHRRLAVGGALLSFAILSKVFPGLLLVTLAAQRRWRAIAWTLAFMLVFTGAGLLILGREPFVAFVSYQLPRLANGQAFSFLERPDVPVFVVSRNFAIYAIAAKLRLIGVAGSSPTLAQALTWAYTVVLVWLAWRARLAPVDRRLQALLWLALLNLAALRSPAAPSAYVAAPMLWMLALLAAETRGRLRVAIALGVAWIVLMGAPPLSDTADVLLGLLGQLLAVALCVWVLMRSPQQLQRARPAIAARHPACAGDLDVGRTPAC